MNICIIGGGNIGTCLSVWIKHYNPEFNVRMLTRRPEQFGDMFECIDVENDISYTAAIDIVSDKAEIAAADADIVYIALPHFAVKDTFKTIAPFVAPEAVICVLPGCGGCEFFFSEYFKPCQTLCGFQRVPFIARIKEYGKSAEIKSWKPVNPIATLQRGRIDRAVEVIEACGLKTRKMDNYMEVALTPSNPILHTSRMYELFGCYDKEHLFDHWPKLYADWGATASKTLFAMDGELQELLGLIEEEGIETSAIRPLPEHYESYTEEAMTAKINGIPSFQSIYSPMIERDGKYAADLSSRLFTEDFTYGLAIFRSYFTIIDLPCPNIDRVLMWYSGYMGLEWYSEGRFCGKDLKDCAILQNYGINTKEDLIKLYLQ